MSYSTRTYTPGSSTTTFALTTSGGDPIGYIRESDIEVKVNGSVQATSAYSFSGTKTVEQPSGGNIVLNSGVTGTVVLARTTAIQDATVVYTAGSTLTSTDLNNADNQIRFGLQEFSDDYASLLGTGGNLTNLASFIGGSDTWVSNDAKAATTSAIDGRIDTKTTAKVKDDIIATAPVAIADDSPSTGKITISVDAELTELATMPIATAQSLADLSDAEVQILDGATLTTTELNYVDGVTSAIQSQIDGKQPSDADLTAIGGLAKTDGNIIVGDGSTWVAENGATARTSLGAQAQDADLDTLSGMQTGAAAKLAALTATEIETLDGITASTAELNKLDGVTSTTAEINYVDGVTSNIQTQLDAKQPLDAELTELATMAGTTASSLADLTQAEVQILDGATLSTTELNYVDGVTSAVQTQLDAKQPLDPDLTTLAGMQGATASILAGGTALTSTLTELNQLDGKTLGETSLTTTSDTAIPTSKAVNDRILTVTNAIGGFVAIDNESSFPNTHPDPSAGAGTVVSIADVGGLVVNSSGVATNAATVGGTAVTINGIATTFRGTTMTSGVGMQVQTTSTLNTYTYHKAILRDQDISSISTDIEDFGNRYRVGSSDPGSNNDEGDLFFNTTSNTMKVYDGSNWGEVTSTGDFKYLFLCPKSGGSGAPTFDGSETEFDLRETSNSGTGASVTKAAQLIVSVNGVVQEANNGTSTSGLDGFVMLDANTIKFCGAPVSGDDIFVIQIGSAVTLNSPANNTVSTDVLQNLAVTTGKIADDAVTADKLANSINTEIAANTAKVTNATHTGEVTGATALTIADDVVDEANLKVSNSPTNGYYLQAQSGNTGGLTWAAVSQYTTPLTTQGDVLYRDGSGDARLAAGTAGQVLTSGGAGANVSWADAASTTLDGCAYENSQTISAGTYSIAAGKGAHSVGPITNNGTVTVNGRWVIS